MKIFWSWQSDNHQKSGRYFVRDVLNDLVKEMNTLDGTDEAERGEDVGPIEVDHDTKDIGGSPPIAETILKKIREAAVFVADVTPVGRTDGGKQLANPNVMIELGYAIHALGHERIVLVMNKSAHASLDTLPFDLRHWRGPVVYDLAADASPESKKEQKKNLKAELYIRIRPSLQVAAYALLEKQRPTTPRPMFELALKAQTHDSPSTIGLESENARLTQLEKEKAARPKLAIPAVDPEHTTRPSGLVRSMIFYIPPPPSKWTRKETESYNEKLDIYFARYEKYLVELAGYQQLKQRTFITALSLSNTGTAPGTDIDVEILVPDGVSLYESTNLPEPPERPEPPPLDPSPPIRSFQQTPQWAGADIYKPESKNWTRVQTEKGTVRYHVQKLKHGYLRESGDFALVFEANRNVSDVEISYSISADECPEATTGTVKLELPISTE